MALDSHSHIHEKGVDAVRSILSTNEVLPVLIGHSYKSNLLAVDIGEKLNLPFVIGLAPQLAQSLGISAINKFCRELEAMVESVRPNAIGEVGLDNHWAKTEIEKKRQIYAFNKMIDLAEAFDLPIVIHSRQSIMEIIDILSKRSFQNSVVFHFFSDSDKEAESALNALDAYLSIPTLHSKKRKKAISFTPLNRLLVETDSPYVAPSPLDVRESIKYIADVKSISKERVESETAKNAANVFNINLSNVKRFKINWQ